MNGSKIQGTLSVRHIRDRMRMLTSKCSQPSLPHPESSPGQESSMDARLLLWTLGMQNNEKENEEEEFKG